MFVQHGWYVLRVCEWVCDCLPGQLIVQATLWGLDYYSKMVNGLNPGVSVIGRSRRSRQTNNRLGWVSVPVHIPFQLLFLLELVVSFVFQIDGNCER